MWWCMQAPDDSSGEPSAKRARPNDGRPAGPLTVSLPRAPPKKAPPKKGAPKKAPMSARKSLNAQVLTPILAKIRDQVKQVNAEYLKWFKVSFCSTNPHCPQALITMLPVYNAARSCHNRSRSLIPWLQKSAAAETGARLPLRLRNLAGILLCC